MFPHGLLAPSFVSLNLFKKNKFCYYLGMEKPIWRHDCQERIWCHSSYISREGKLHHRDLGGGKCAQELPWGGRGKAGFKLAGLNVGSLQGIGVILRFLSSDSWMLSVVDTVLECEHLLNEEVRNKLVDGFIFARQGLLWLSCLWKY